MSETVRYKGKLIKIEKLDNETLEDQCKRLLNNVKLDSYYDTYVEMLLDEYYEKYTVLDNSLYKIYGSRLSSECEFFDGKRNEDDSIDFHVMYYNGGCCLPEALEEVYNKLK